MLSLSSLEYELALERRAAACARTSACELAKLNPPARRAIHAISARLLRPARAAPLRRPHGCKRSEHTEDARGGRPERRSKLKRASPSPGAAVASGGAGSRRPRALRPLGLRIGDAGPCDVCLCGASER